MDDMPAYEAEIRDRQATERRRKLEGAYREVFGGIVGQLVLDDLSAFTRASGRLDARTADGSIDPLSMCVLEGRRQVRLHIARRLGQPLAFDPPRETGHEQA